ncbi:hypothetical protein B0H14DRAFT_2736870 [Mycena olivaceomarginata]|nr:hypothetical protein B0H14DRAFT_2736870 [Mycena olivaceomarginata]
MFILPSCMDLTSLQQPGDWICLKCNYLNWRRRKVLKVELKWDVFRGGKNYRLR